MRPVQWLILTHERLWRKLARRVRRHYLALVLGSLGKDCQVCDGVLITDPEFTFIGDRVTINEGAILLTFSPEASIHIGNDVTISYGVNLLTGGLECGAPGKKHVTAPVTIEDGVWLGAQAIVLAGVTVGRGAVVAAGSVVTRDVPAYTVVAGAPARILRTVSNEKAA